MRDNVSKLGTVQNALASLPVNKVNVTGASANLAGYNAASLYINAGTWTDGVHTFTIQESPDNTTWTNVAATDLVAWSATSTTSQYPSKTGFAQPNPISSAPTALNQRIGYLGAMQYVRVTIAVTGAPATGAAYDAYWILGEPRLLPSAV